MNITSKILFLFATVAMLTLCGCATQDNGYVDEKEYSDMPWATPENWEAAPTLPGMSPGY